MYFKNVFFWDTTVNSFISLYILNITVLFHLAHENELQWERLPFHLWLAPAAYSVLSHILFTFSSNQFSSPKWFWFKISTQNSSAETSYNICFQTSFMSFLSAVRSKMWLLGIPHQHFTIEQEVSRNVSVLLAVNICKIRFRLVRFRHWKRHSFWLWLIFKDYVVLYLSWFSFALCSHTSFCSFPLAQMFPKQESTIFCSKKSYITSLIWFQKEVYNVQNFLSKCELLV